MATLTFDNQALNRTVAPKASPVATALMVAGQTLAKWETRSRTRAHLRDLCPSRYPDLGLTTAEVLIEVKKPFWVA